MKILVVGHQGYIGAVLGLYLRRLWPEAELVGLDTGYYATADVPGYDKHIKADIRDVEAPLLAGVDGVVALAAISNDPMSAAYAQATDAINRAASVRLAALCARAGVRRFVLASSCSVYGFAEGLVSESAALQPQTAYASSKVAAEDEIAALELGQMSVTCLRFATACGWSERLRLDLALNDFVASALKTGAIFLRSDGTAWRPFIDVVDMSRAIAWAAEREGGILRVNVGAVNIQIRDLAQQVAELTGACVRFADGAVADQRSYRVDFSLFRRLAPRHQPQVTLAESIAQLRQGLQAGLPLLFPIRLHRLRELTEAGLVDTNLRWT